MTKYLVEVRIPTYKREISLRRALASLRNQTWKEWRAVIYDDSPTQEARAVAAEINDGRINYHHNTRQLGAAGNLDQAFNTRSVAGGKYAFILEDDNGIKSDFIERNVHALSESGLSLLLREQEIYDEIETGGWRPTGLKSKDRLYGKSGFYSASWTQSVIFFDDQIANGGLFWDTENLRSELVVGECVRDSGLQEICRTVQIIEPLLYCAEPLSIWTRGNTSYKSVIDNRFFGRAVQAIQQKLLDLQGSVLKKFLIEMASSLKMESILRKNLASLGSLRHSFLLPHDSMTLTLLSKGIAKKMVVENRLSNYLKTSGFLEAAKTFRACRNSISF